MKKSTSTFIMALFSAAALALSAQAPALASPEINADSSATFRLRAPEARDVQLRCEGVPDSALTKNGDGVWTFTTAPLAPDIYHYSFLVDGVRMTDPANPHLKYNLLSSASELIVPSPAGTAPQIWERANPDAPRGTLHKHSFKSKVSGDDRDFIVYTPPGYDPAANSGERYPVLYLLHGYSDDATAWTTAGRANTILDNLIVAGKARPMIVVMPLGYGTLDVVRAGWQGMRKEGIWEKNLRDFDPILTGEVLPRVEAAYRVSTKREDRAIAGLSMGGTESLGIGLNHIDQFAWIGAFSSGGLPADFGIAYPKFNDTTAKQIRLIWIACGKDDQLIGANKKLSEWIKAKAPAVPLTYTETPYGHTFRNWRRYLADLAPLLFQK